METGNLRLLRGNDELAHQWETRSTLKNVQNVQFSQRKGSRAPTVPQQQIHGSFSGIILLMTLKEPL